MLRKQLFIACNGGLGAGGNPSARDVAALNHILSWAVAGKYLVVPYLRNDLERPPGMKMVEYVAPGVTNGSWWYPDDISPKMLAPRI